MKTLQTGLEQEFMFSIGELNISEHNKESLISKMTDLKSYHPPTFYHSLRVAILAKQSAKVRGWNARALFWAGALHDYGKIEIPLQLLSKETGFDSDDMCVMKEHPVLTYDSLKTDHPYTALVGGSHHRHQKNPYPEKDLDLLVGFSFHTRRKMMFHAKIISLFDFYDAAKTRSNDKHGGKKQLSSCEVRYLLSQQKPEFEFITKTLYDAKIFD